MSKAPRTLPILTAHGSLRVTDLAGELIVAVRTAQRMPQITGLHGFVEHKEGSRRYRLGPAARATNSRPPPTRIGPDDGERVETLRAVQGPVVERADLARLSAERGETVNLLVRGGSDAVFLDGAESRQPARVATRTGSRIPAGESAGRKAILAQSPFAAVRSRYAGGLTRATRYTLPDLSGLERDLELTREPAATPATSASTSRRSARPASPCTAQRAARSPRSPRPGPVRDGSASGAPCCEAAGDG